VCSNKDAVARGDSMLTLEEMPILSGFVAYFEGNISTKIKMYWKKLRFCNEFFNQGCRSFLQL